MILRIHDIVAQLSVREFSELCSLVDRYDPHYVLIEKKFDIIKIVRDGDKTLCWLDFGHGRMIWCEISKYPKLRDIPRTDLQVAA